MQITPDTQAPTAGTDEFRADEQARKLALSSGVPVEDILDALAVGWRVRDYSLVRRSGATHAEALEARAAFGHRIYDYALARSGGVPHQELLAAARGGGDLSNYLWARMFRFRGT